MSGFWTILTILKNIIKKAVSLLCELIKKFETISEIKRIVIEICSCFIWALLQRSTENVEFIFLVIIGFYIIISFIFYRLRSKFPRMFRVWSLLRIIIILIFWIEIVQAVFVSLWAIFSLLVKRFFWRLNKWSYNVKNKGVLVENRESILSRESILQKKVEEWGLEGQINTIFTPEELAYIEGILNRSSDAEVEEALDRCLSKKVALKYKGRFDMILGFPDSGPKKIVTLTNGSIVFKIYHFLKRVNNGLRK